MRLFEIVTSAIYRFRLIGFSKSENKQQRKIIFLNSFIMLFVLIPSTGFTQSTSEFQLPNPTGPYNIGTEFLYFIDENRPDTYTSDLDDYREISLRVWYPAEPKANEIPMNYVNKEAAELFVNLGFVNPSFLDEVASRPTHSYLKAKVANEEDSYPVILFSASGIIDANSLMAEDLASNGYVVFCIGHPHWLEYYFDADGKIFFLDKENEYYKKMWEEENSEIVEQTKEQLTRATTVKDKLALQRKLNENMPAD